MKRTPSGTLATAALPALQGPSALVFFGVTGDLARKKLLPAVYDLMNRGLLPPSFGLVGFGRRSWSDDDFRPTYANPLKHTPVPLPRRRMEPVPAGHAIRRRCL